MNKSKISQNLYNDVIFLTIQFYTMKFFSNNPILSFDQREKGARSSDIWMKKTQVNSILH